MSDEIVSGDTTEGSVPSLVEGDAEGSTTETPVSSVEAGTAEASAPVELPEALRDKYVETERYQNLEKKLGNWSEVEKQAALYQQYANDPRVQAALAPQETSEPETLPDFSTMQPQEVISWMDKRMEQRAEQIAQSKIEEFRKENVDPMAKDLYTRQANEMVQSMESKYPDFKEKREAIADFLDQNPALAENLNEKSLEMAYRFVAFEEQQKKGAAEAVKKLQTKAKDTAVKPQGSSTSTGKPKANTIADAWAMAEEGTIN